MALRPGGAGWLACASWISAVERGGRDPPVVGLLGLAQRGQHVAECCDRSAAETFRTGAYARNASRSADVHQHLAAPFGVGDEVPLVQAR